MVKRPVIQHYLSPDIWKRTKEDLQQLLKLINGYGGEYSLQLRENYFNIYYRGNSLAKVIPNKNGTYSAEINQKFLQLDRPARILEKLEKYSKKNTRKNSDYICFSRIKPGDFCGFFREDHLTRISGRIRKRGYGEEIAFEQVLITDNPPSENFIIIDRQVADHDSKAQIDLLTLRRDSADRLFHFVVIEVKLGRNPELREKVGEQLNNFINHIRKYIKDYASCYKENYRQKKELGLFDPCLPNEIEIDPDPKTVEGLIVVGGYSGLAEQALQKLHQKIREKRWDVKVQRMRNEIEFGQRVLL